MYLTISGQDVMVNDPDGSSHKFTYNGSGFTRPNGDYRRVILNTDQSYTVLETSGLKYNFGAPQNGTCRLNSVVDRFGNTLTLNYDGSTGFLTSVADPSGRITATLEYNYYDPVTQRNLLSAIRFTPLEPGASSSRYVTFSYQGGKLAEVRYPASGGSSEVAVDYTYDSVVGLLSSARVCLISGGIEQSNSRRNDTLFGYKPYKRSVGVISTYFTQGGARVPVSYYFNYNGDTTTVTDPGGNQMVYNHYGSGSLNNGQLMSIVYPDCKKADGTAATKPAPIYYIYDSDYNLKTSTRLKDVYNPTTGLDDPETSSPLIIIIPPPETRNPLSWTTAIRPWAAKS